MTHKPNSISTQVAGQPSCPRPVRVKLMRTGAYLEKAYPPDGDGKNWWQRLNKALGTVSSDFVNASLLQILMAKLMRCKCKCFDACVTADSNSCGSSMCT